MTNRGIAIKIKQIVPWWETDGDIYKQTMEILESNDKKLLTDLYKFIKDYHNAEKIAQEIQKRIYGNERIYQLKYVLENYEKYGEHGMTKATPTRIKRIKRMIKELEDLPNLKGE